MALDSLGEIFIGIQDAVRIEDVLELFEVVENQGRLLEVQILNFVETNSMLGTDAALPFDYFLEHLLVLSLLLLLHDHVDVDIAVPDVPITHYLSLDGPSQLSHQFLPLLDLKGQIISNHFATHPSCN